MQHPRFDAHYPRPYSSTQHDPDFAGGAVTPRRLAGLYVVPADDQVRIHERLVTKHWEALQGPAQDLFDDCRQMVRIADYFQGVGKPMPLRPDMHPYRRRQCLGHLWAARFDKTVGEGMEAVDAARRMSTAELAKILAMEAGSASLACAALGLSTAAGIYGVGMCGTAAHNAWQAGGLIGKAKALGFGFLGLNVAMICGGFALGSVQTGVNVLRELEEERKDVMEDEWGRDAIFCEILMNRRYLREAALRA